MSILQGGLTVRRYRVYGEVKDTFRNDFEEALQRYAFHEPRSASRRSPRTDAGAFARAFS